MEQTLGILKVIPKAKVHNRKPLPVTNTASEKRCVGGVSCAARPTDALCTFHMVSERSSACQEGTSEKQVPALRARVSPNVRRASWAHAKVESNPAVCLQYSLSGKEAFVITLFIGYRDNYYT